MEWLIAAYIVTSVGLGISCWIEEFLPKERGLRRVTSLPFCIVAIVPAIVYVTVKEIVQWIRN